ncbi:hypothetical protein Anapl_07207 [Anas platyrhynchos]|uniref:Uncharacterized protein n=1 Tax=Anas platyrhynchos TaxID=8839 RepID=R0JVW8_ANAPL|nr:hypothetical protein Anapl_07207 [Anas platyrhynchos]
MLSMMKLAVLLIILPGLSVALSWEQGSDLLLAEKAKPYTSCQLSSPSSSKVIFLTRNYISRDDHRILLSAEGAESSVYKQFYWYEEHTGKDGSLEGTGNHTLGKGWTGDQCTA